MRVKFRFVSLLLLLVLLVGAGRPAWAQRAEVRVVEETARGMVVEITAEWRAPLRALLDSSDADAVARTFAALAAQGAFTAHETIALPALVAPRVQVLAADYDEIPLRPATGLAELATAFGRAPVAVEGVGMERRRAAGTLRAELVRYDEAAGTLRRYRRLLLSIEYGNVPAERRLSGFGARLAVTDNPHLDVTRSALADGTIFKIEIREEGLYRIDRNFLSELGLTPGSIDPNRVKILGNGGAPLPALNSAPRIPDLAENPVFVRGGGDGVFNEGDAVFFYGAAPTGWQYDAASGQWQHYVHPFSNANYYFLKIDGAESKRVGLEAFPGFADATVVEQVTGRHFREFDSVMWAPEAGTGHTWVSRRISPDGALEIFKDIALPGMAGGEVQFVARSAIRSNPLARVFYEAGGQRLAEDASGFVGGGLFLRTAAATTTTFSQALGAGAPLNLTMRLEKVQNAPEAALDWIRAFYPQALRARDGWLRFATPGGQSGRFEFVLRGFSAQPQVWDVTEPGNIRRLEARASGDGYRVQLDVADAAQPREITAFIESAARVPAPNRELQVGNQDLHGIQTFPDFVIVTPAAFVGPARELAEMRRQDGLAVEVVDVQHIYNEFSGGVPDMRAVRDYFKFLYDRAPDANSLLRYALLFGDGHFDYRNLGDNTSFENWVLPYETEESFNAEFSYTSDDYFGLLDDAEGVWNYPGSTATSTERVDLGIGRFTVQTLDEAQVVVDKIRRYENPETFGPWRTRYTFVADDGYNGRDGSPEVNNRDLHTQNVEVVADLVEQVYPRINQQKIYAASYDRVFETIWRIPGARQDIREALNDGTLIMNYSGHGGELGLAQEEILTIDDAWALQNRDRLAIFITATCSFGRWDLANHQSGAEALLLNPNGGAVALMTTVRTVLTSSGVNTLNVGLNRALNQDLFTLDEQGLPPRLGDVMRATKNTQAGAQGNNRKFNLLGDPTMRAGMPTRQAVVEEVNGVPLGEQPAPLRALDRVTIKGSVQTPDGFVDGGFNGLASLEIFDAKRRVMMPYADVLVSRPYYMQQEDLIWSGRVNVADGRFEAVFVVPKDISYSNAPGRISSYAFSDASHAQGVTENVVVGGSNPNPPNDAAGPELRLFLSDTTFVSGGVVRAEPTLIVKLFDETGVNTVGAGVGHEMLLVVDGNESDAVNLSEFYQSEPNSYQRGQVTYELNPLEPGPHTLSVKAWDVVNNSSIAALDFTVAEEAALALRNVFNYPNPTSGQTRFIFEHNQPGSLPAKVQIRIYTLDGRPVRTLEQDDVLSGGRVQITWDGRDEDFDPLASGIYLYKVRVEVEQPGGERQVSEKIERLAVIR